jgi:hypothetical protein
MQIVRSKLLPSHRVSAACDADLSLLLSGSDQRGLELAD